jgi:GT2 family glycosyltransferase
VRRRSHPLRSRPVSARVSAVVVAFRHDVSVLDALLRALAAQSPPPCEVLVVDNGGDPALDAAGASSGLSVRVLRPPANLGYVGASNLAASDATGDWLLFVNPDSLPAPDALEHLLAAADPDTALVGAQILLPDRERVNAGDNPLHIAGVSWSGRLMEPLEHGPPRDVAVASGAFLLVRTADFAALGGYHDGYFLYHDDVDLAWRARLAGRQVRYVPDALVVHDYDFEKGTYKWFWLERNRLWTVLSNYEARTLALMAPVLLAMEAAVLVFALRGGWWREKLRSWRALWRERRELRGWRAAVQGRRHVPDAELLRAMTGRLDSPELAATGVGAAGSVMEGYRRAVAVLLRLLG